ncbi:MAG: putative bifunctional diguanylate cyclase/phosphodiesterase [Alphaproteobacteria bacterium]
MSAKILCIEDEAPLRRVIAAELRDAGYETLEASNGREGLDVIREHRPDLVLCDISMPIMNGYEALTELRDLDTDYADVPVIFLSALTDRRDFIMGRQLGVDDYLTKPVDMDLLLATVASRLQRVRKMGLRYEQERSRLDKERRRVEERLHHLETHDEATGLANLALLTSQLEAGMGEVVEGSGPGVILIEIDRFRSVSATLGRSYADELVMMAASRLSDTLTEGRVLARVSDERFACQFQNGVTIATLEQVADTVRRNMAEPYAIGGRKIFTTVALGLAVHPDHGATADALLTHAETALHAAIRQGGNCFRSYSTDMAVRSLKRLAIEEALRSALESHELELNFQPKMSVDGKRLVGMEALLRWNSASMGPVSPAVFIPVAEESGMILAIGEYVLREACRHTRSWQDIGLPQEVQVAVNVSVEQFQQPNFVSLVENVLRETTLPCQSLVLEITESGLVEDERDLIATLGALRDLGVTLSIDDFGTGYSSLSYLGRLPAHELKIDQSFVRGLPETAGSRSIVEAVIAIASSLNLKLVAEGVETTAQLDFLRQRGVPVAQGYFFSRPLSASAFEAFFREHLNQDSNAEPGERDGNRAIG